MPTAKLLDENETPDRYDSMVAREQEQCLRTSRTCSAIVGFCIGVFIQCSSLALNFVLNNLAGDDPIPLTTYTLATTVWSTLSGVLGVSVMLLMRSMIVTTFYSTNTTIEEALLVEKEIFMSGVISNLEKFFSVGAVAGVGFAWATTDYLLQIDSHIIESSLVFVIAFVWYCVSPKDSF